MVEDPNLFWFGWVLWSVCVLVIITWMGGSKKGEVANLNPTYSIKYANVTDSEEEEKIEELRQECLRLREKLDRQSNQLKADFQNATFSQLQALFTNYPSIRKMVETKPDLPAKNLVSLFTALDNVLDNWEYEIIGSPWEQVPFDPQFYQPDTSDIAPGELVYIRFVGYRNGDRILVPAKVSRTLPAMVSTTNKS